jgi:pimeloyl-ACP methyl ester carboxylesterase
MAAPSLPIDVPVPGDRPLRVAQGLANVERAIVYLHGMCGAEKGADVWADLATKYGTLITVRADVPCDDRPGYKWPKDPSAMQARIEQALELVRDLRGGRLSERDVVLIGYSQGAHRAERLAATYPHRYRTLVLGGPPGAASPERLRHARRVAVLGGELEDTSHMVDGYLALRAAGIDAEFFTLPRAGHGGYGPEGRRIIAEVFAYVLP